MNPTKARKERTSARERFLDLGLDGVIWVRCHFFMTVRLDSSFCREMTLASRLRTEELFSLQVPLRKQIINERKLT